jgi:hypothetical protein
MKLTYKAAMVVLTHSNAIYNLFPVSELAQLVESVSQYDGMVYVVTRQT